MIKDFITNVITKVSDFFDIKGYGNQDYAKKEIQDIYYAVSDDFDTETEESAKEKLLEDAKDTLESNKTDIIAYLRNEYLEQDVAYEELYAKKTVPRKKYIKEQVLQNKMHKFASWGIGLLVFVNFSGIGLVTSIVAGVLSGIYIPKMYELYLVPTLKANKKYKTLVDKIEDKLNTIEKVEIKEVKDEKEEESDLRKIIGLFSTEVIKVLKEIKEDPYPGCEKEIATLMALNNAFIEEQFQNKTTLAPQLLLNDYQGKLMDIENYVKASQAKYLNAKTVASYATLDNDSVTLDTGIPNLTPQRKGRYRVKSN